MLDIYLRAAKERLLNAVLEAKFVDRSLRNVHPNTITLLSGVLGLVSASLVATGLCRLGLLCWLLNRLLDGLDGTVARRYGKQSDFGGYLDIVVDFSVYAALPVAFSWFLEADKLLWALTSLLEGVYFVNAAGLFYLAALLEKQEKDRILTGRQPQTAAKELTSVPLPAALVEGFESFLVMTLFFVFPTYSGFATLCTVMALGVSISVGQRLAWAKRNL